jgi:hypothetical protein
MFFCVRTFEGGVNDQGPQPTDCGWHAFGTLLMVHADSGFQDSSPYHRAYTVYGQNGPTNVSEDLSAINDSAIHFYKSNPAETDPNVYQSYVQYVAPGGFLASAEADFTLEFFVNLDTVVYTGYTDGRNEWIRLGNGGSPVLYFAAANGSFTDEQFIFGGTYGGSATAGTYPTGTYIGRHHFAFQRSCSLIQIWIDGTLAHESVDPAPSFNFDTINLGNMALNRPHEVGGTIEEVRLSWGLRYTAPFTPTTVPLPDYDPMTVPDAPTITRVIAGDGQAIVYYTTADFIGNTPLTSNTITSTPGGITASGLTSPITITGLTNGTAYTFTCHSTNAIGNSAESAASDARTPREYATLNPSDKGAGITLSFGNTIAVWADQTMVRSTVGVTTGYVAWEVTFDSGTYPMLGIASGSAALTNYPGADVYGWGYFVNGHKYHNGDLGALGSNYNPPDVLRFELNMVDGECEVFLNNASQGMLATGLTGQIHAAFGDGNSSPLQVTVNFGQEPFVNAPTGGFTEGMWI